ncbi:uncharacterized protein Z519_04303 [Cladophialophora bantiana CBS 173.52]|uniref:Uncharacterized protein n=1 Tax=Cladophialophora bantiana (strain ATCC 10958 / CBS 173.52 / CDC B-1940 / NIH 8579) TaxID=1442370 RepID=A0A0D2HQJ1_CLAB1|nr:uncharacterized protein Z519_04303 [Cladophialophora bantiana CBS 173.52]KIW95718.1 hypothetical protein Z519_04303 [Cladophialophora bantiana CBS 173.52]
MAVRERVILYTGANRGICFAIIQALASHPETATSTLLPDRRDPEKGKAAVQELSGKGVSTTIAPIMADVNSNRPIRDAVGLVEHQYGHLDVLINNTGYGAIPVASDYSDWRDTYAEAALNTPTVEMSRDPANKGVEFQLVGPGHCNTAFNSYRGDQGSTPRHKYSSRTDQAEKGKYKNASFWETKRAILELVEIPW